jgi:predicted DCC family thiol-disulfide oxidoreductase YuxK
MRYTVIYDGDCNLCSNLVQLLERIDRGIRPVIVAVTRSKSVGLCRCDRRSGLSLRGNSRLP